MDLKSRLVQKIQATGQKLLPKELREYDALIKAIGECKSKSEEDRIISAEVDLLRQRLADPKLDKSRAREYLIRLLYCEMLGHDVSFAHVKAMQFASESSIHAKKAAYLALTQFLDHNNELVLLLVNTLLSDLKSDNYVIVCTALVVATRLIGPDLINAVLPVVIERLHHPKEHVRKKAIMALHRFHQLDPRREGPLAGVDLDRHFRTMLCDKDPSVMSAALCALHEVIKQDPRPYKNLIPSFTSILKQVSEHRLPKSYDYHRFPAPFIQIKLLKVLSALGHGDRVASENMYAVLQQTLRRANSSHTIGNALICECVRTITTIYPNPHLLAAAAESISTFLRSTSHNLRYVGIDALAGIVKINPQYAQEHQMDVLDCLEDPDDTLKLKTLELLYKMTKASNVEVIVEKMMGYLRTAHDEHIKRDIVRKVSELAERYAPSPAWFIRVGSEVFELGGEHTGSPLAHSLMRLIAEQDTELHRSAVEIYLRLLDKPKLPELLLQVICWVLGEYGVLAASIPGRNLSAQQVMDKLVGILTAQKATDAIRSYILVALSKLCVQSGSRLTPEAEAFVNKSSSSQSVELQQRAYELQALLNATPKVQQGVLPVDASCEEFDETEMSQLKGLDFLGWYVDEALRNGASPYVPEEQRHPHAAHNGDKGGHLRFEAYEPAPAAAPSAAHTRAMSSSSGQSGSAFDAFGDFAASHAGMGAPSAGVAAPGHSRTPSGTAGPHEPQLMLRGASGAAGGAARKWGPAQYETSTSAAAARPGGGLPPPASAAGDLLGGLQQPTASSRGVAAAPKPPSERDRLAASIFGSLSASGTVPAPPVSKPQPQQPTMAAAPDLLAFDSPAKPVHVATASAPPQPAVPAAANPMDLLMDFAPSSSATGAPVQGMMTSNAAATTSSNVFDLLGGLSAGIGPAAGAPGGIGTNGLPTTMFGAGSGMGQPPSLGLTPGMMPHTAMQPAYPMVMSAVGPGAFMPSSVSGMGSASGMQMGAGAMSKGVAGHKADPFGDLLS